jgi:hypothetical protein
LSEENCLKAICKRFQNEEGGNFALVAVDNNVYKSGVLDNDQSSINSYIAIHNKRTKEIKLFQATQATFKHVIYDNERSMFEQNIVDAKKVLHKDFSGKKGAIAYDRKARAVDNSNLLETSIQNTVDTINTDSFLIKDKFDEDHEKRDELRASIFPQIKGNANSIRDIFDFNNLVGEEMVQHLSGVTIDVLNMDAKTFPFVNGYIKTMMKFIQQSKAPDSDANIKKASILIYADALTHLMVSRQKKLTPIRISPLSAELGQDIINKFTQNGQSMSTFSTQKSIIYYVILMLMSTDKMEMFFEDLLDNMTISKKDLLKYAQIIGCKVKGNRLSISKANIDSNSKFIVPLQHSGKKKRGMN